MEISIRKTIMWLRYHLLQTLFVRRLRETWTNLHAFLVENGDFWHLQPVQK
ncbi:hypothetical protein HanIR_Chr12g0573851 [Helianthus annuus]|nr:hypothetical protein HanIR_Chr12g0573851 [Helianthus annuus]